MRLWKRNINSIEEWAEGGPPFVVTVRWPNGQRTFVGEGPSKAKAREEALIPLLRAIDLRDPTVIDDVVAPATPKTPTSALLEFCQLKRLPNPERNHDRPNDAEWECTIVVNGREFKGSGSSKSQSAHNASHLALECFAREDDDAHRFLNIETFQKGKLSLHKGGPFVHQSETREIEMKSGKFIATKNAFITKTHDILPDQPVILSFLSPLSPSSFFDRFDRD